MIGLQVFAFHITAILHDVEDKKEWILDIGYITDIYQAYAAIKNVGKGINRLMKENFWML